jgi:hypothetical protein
MNPREDPLVGARNRGHAVRIVFAEFNSFDIPMSSGALSFPARSGRPGQNFPPEVRRQNKLGRGCLRQSPGNAACARFTRSRMQAWSGSGGSEGATAEGSTEQV